MGKLPDEFELKAMAKRLLDEYLLVSAVCRTEPESYFEGWIRKSVLQSSAHLEKWVWRYFMDNLFEYRKLHKSQ